MTRRDAQERDRRAFGTAPILLPVAKRVDADPDRQRELGWVSRRAAGASPRLSGFEPAENEAPRSRVGMARASLRRVSLTID